MKFDLASENREDVVQEVFISIWARASTLNIRSSLASYLHAAVRFKIFDLIAKEKLKTNYLDSLQAFLDKGVYQTDQVIRDKDLNHLIQKGVDELPPRMKLVFQMSRENGLSQKEIAEQLNISDKTVKKQIGF